MVQPLSLALRTETSSAHEDAEGLTCVEEVLLAHHDGVDAAGLNFYRFTQIPQPKRDKDSCRARLDGLDLDEGTRVPEHAATGGPA